MTRHLDVTPPDPYWRLLKTLLYALFGVACLLILVTYVTGAEVQTLIDKVELSCGGSLEGWDTDHDASTGAELLIIKTAQGTVVATVTFGPGADGTFLQAEVTIPNHPKEAYHTLREFAEKYPHPCDVIMAGGEPV